MTKPFEIRVDTDHLRKFLEGEPEVMLKLTSFATEKIAEEIMRKSRTTKLSGDLERQIDSVIRLKMNDLKCRFTMPKEVKDAIEDHLKTSVAPHRFAIEHGLKLSVEARQRQAEIDFNAIVKKTVAEIRTELGAEIRKIARAEFLSVLQEVRSI